MKEYIDVDPKQVIVLQSIDAMADMTPLNTNFRSAHFEIKIWSGEGRSFFSGWFYLDLFRPLHRKKKKLQSKTILKPVSIYRIRFWRESYKFTINQLKGVGQKFSGTDSTLRGSGQYPK